jgi:hypothetical protein
VRVVPSGAAERRRTPLHSHRSGTGTASQREGGGQQLAIAASQPASQPAFQLAAGASKIPGAAGEGGASMNVYRSGLREGCVGCIAAREQLGPRRRRRRGRGANPQPAHASAAANGRSTIATVCRLGRRRRRGGGGGGWRAKMFGHQPRGRTALLLFLPQLPAQGCEAGVQAPELGSELDLAWRTTKMPQPRRTRRSHRREAGGRRGRIRLQVHS